MSASPCAKLLMQPFLSHALRMPDLVLSLPRPMTPSCVVRGFASNAPPRTGAPFSEKVGTSRAGAIMGERNKAAAPMNRPTTSLRAGCGSRMVASCALVGSWEITRKFGEIESGLNEVIRENPASRGTETSAEVLVGPPRRMVSNAGQQQWY